MNKLIRYWNQNRLMIVIIIIIIVLVIAIIRVINGLLENTKEVVEQEKWKIPDLSNPTESVISGGEVTQEEADENSIVIKQFVDYCNNHLYENAYALLSQECKEELFEDIDIFTNDYVDEIFDLSKSYTLELWFSSSQGFTYRILYINDNILSSGTVDDNSNKEDYITIVEENGEKKLNISNFIYKDEINKSNSNSNIEITVNNSSKYRSYETYNITIKNISNKTILLSSGNNPDDVCLIDTNEVEYNAIINEVPLVNLELIPGAQRTINIRFYKMYNTYREVEKITFKNIILDKESYEINSNDAQTVSVSVDI